MSTTIRSLFDEKLPSVLAAHSAQLQREVNAVIGVRVTGEGGGEWAIEAASNQGAAPARVVPLSEVNCSVVVEISAEDFEALRADRSKAMAFYFTGKLKVKGDPLKALKLEKILALVEG